jgi:hypothetical protein
MQSRGSDGQAVAMALPAPVPLRIAMQDARDAVIIISYQLIIRVLFLARRWNY